MGDYVSKSLYRLYPPPFEPVALQGLYLKLALHRRGSRETPFVYANFLTSLDGRIALEDATGVPYLPKSMTTPDDFRLFLELECQADCLITHGGYLRALAHGHLGRGFGVRHAEPGQVALDGGMQLDLAGFDELHHGQRGE